MVVVSVLVADADDTEPLRIERLRPFVHPSLKLNFDLYVNDLLEIGNYIPDLLALQRNGAGAPFLTFVGYHQVCTAFQPTHEVAAVLIDRCKQAVLEIGLIEQHQPIFEPWASI